MNSQDCTLGSHQRLHAVVGASAPRTDLQIRRAILIVQPIELVHSANSDLVGVHPVLPSAIHLLT